MQGVQLSSLASCLDGRSLLVGAGDGSLTRLVITDPADKESLQFVRSLPSRKTLSTKLEE